MAQAQQFKLGHMTGNALLDPQLTNELQVLINTFGVRPGFFMLDDSMSGPNAFAIPAVYLPGTEATVAFGYNLMMHEFRQTQAPVNYTISAIMAHEIAAPGGVNSPQDEKTAPRADVPGTCDRGCGFIVQIGNIHDYQIYIDWQAFASKGFSDTFTGKNTTHNYAVSSGSKWVIHAKWVDKDPMNPISAAGITCGDQVKFSYTGHAPNHCAEYNEAVVTIRRN